MMINWDEIYRNVKPGDRVRGVGLWHGSYATVKELHLDFGELQVELPTGALIWTDIDEWIPIVSRREEGQR